MTAQGIFPTLFWNSFATELTKYPYHFFTLAEAEKQRIDLKQNTRWPWYKDRQREGVSNSPSLAFK